jgi:capsular polysaccharide export protein
MPGETLGPAPRWRRVATFAPGLAALPHVSTLLGAPALVLRPSAQGARGLDAVLAWHDGADAADTTAAARAFAGAHGLPLWHVGPGPLRAIGLPGVGAPMLSVTLDDRGDPSDASAPSRLEQLLADADEPRLRSAELLARARALLDAIVDGDVAALNHAPPAAPAAPTGRAHVLIGEPAGHPRHAELVAAARREWPDAELRLLDDAAAPAARLAGVTRVIVVDGDVGLDALWRGVPVTCLGGPAYAGWGLTDDRAPLPRRGVARTREQLALALLLLAPRYLHPESGGPGTAEDVVAHLALQRREWARNTGRLLCAGFGMWKRTYVRAYLRCPGNRVEFIGGARAAERAGLGPGDRLVVWSHREEPALRELAVARGVPISRMEDGFLRSVGLGSNFEAPASLVVDRDGIYFDPTVPSELERMLESGEFTAAELARAAALRARIVAGGLSKYNVGADADLTTPPGREVVLVPGQVEDDASVRLGGRQVVTNLALLEHARRAHPDAYVIWKPHPDVLSGNRRGEVAAADAAALCDRVETTASLARCLDVAHHVHTITSLVGFEALLRGLRVTVYGQPFYGGWGLTHDLHPLPRRTRRRTVEELVAAVYLRYPRYLDRRTGAFTTAEATIDMLLEARARAGDSRQVELPWPRRQLRKLAHMARGMTRGA